MTTILLVDDDAITLDVMRDALEGAGYSVETLTDPTKALNAAIEQQPDFVVLDLVMPSLGGEELCRQMKLHPLTKHLPILFMSASQDIDDAIMSLHLGCIDYLKKPFSPSDVVNVILKHDVINRFREAWAPAREELTRIIHKYETAV